ncbi:MAG: DNA translocase FtsK [Melioribacteraceae bacterium]|nr:DNA translocase FtsK [Melioribacteraceae bacterium]MCF8263966.1 DNA translocase FtsK [Melioribacteraceae bacterium]MCF8411818.1 DNA translocase FtsK [Melioribacteraceae bacterium]MCF8431813.1 DNA translocase FtsK [Melioribacteraceae bacterium]
MPQKRKNKTSEEDDVFIIPTEKKTKLIGFLLTVIALLLILSILSYSRFDQANLRFVFTDLFKVFSQDPEFQIRVESTHNWLGIFGSYISNFFINNTIGFFSLIFPIVIFIWGYTIIRETNRKTAVYISNFLIVLGVILSTFFGMLRREFEIFYDEFEIAGKVGDFLGMGIGRLFGGLGGAIFLLAILCVSIFIVFDIKLEHIKIFLRKIGINLDKNETESEEKPSEITIKKEKPPAKEKKKILDVLKPGKLEDEPAKETIIEIVKREQERTEAPPEMVQIVPEKLSEDFKKSKGEIEDLDLTEIDKDEEGKLPEQWEEKIKFNFPKIDLLEKIESEDIQIPEVELKRNAEQLKEKLALFDIEIESVSVTPGPVVTLYEIVPAPGVKISRIVGLEHDIALALAARGIRIIAPIPGKSAIGVEIPNTEASMVSARSVLSKIKDSKAQLPLALGKTISGDIYITDLASMPHMLIAGSTGSGKSVGINMIITSLIYSKHPSEIKFVIIDPKKIELSFYGKLNKHYLAVSPDLDEEIITNPQNALLLLKSVEHEMEKRYDKLAKVGVRHIIDYNARISDPKKRPQDTDKMKHYKMPYLIVIIDELADLMMTSGKEVEEPIARLAQLARAVGIHLIVATQRPSVNVITGVIKANFSARIAYQVATKIDSRTILDMNGAEQLLGKGDMLFLPGGMPKPVRIQNAFISTEEVERVTNFIYVQEGFSKRFFLPSMFEKKASAQGSFLADIDPMFNDAAEVIVRHQQGSVSLLQRRLKLGYSRAARIVDQLEEAGIVGPSEGSKAREVLVETDDQLQLILKNLS